jgi:DNA-binding transcriptional ArsR family regulator
VDDVFAVLSDPTRRRILEALRPGERSVMELVDRVGMHQPGVSRHLGILREAGLVKVRKEAQRRQYSLVTGPLQELDAWLDHYRGLWDARFVKLANHLATRKRSDHP